MSLISKTTKALGPAGTLARHWDAFEFRDDQLELALAVAAALDDRAKLAAEAGTGTGKTLAYLVPVLLWGGKTIVSTATKTLQEQIIDKDLPRLTGLMGLKIDACLVKGRRNYLCRHRLEKSIRDGRLEAYLGQKLDAWAEVSENGDIAEVDFLVEDDPVWLRLTASSDMCLGPGCDFFGNCFITRLRRRAAAARLVVVNHHLFMADLALRQTGHGQVLPESEAVVFDEAHELEEAATSHFTVTVSDLRIHDLMTDLAETLPEPARAKAMSLGPTAAELFTTLLAPVESADRFPLTDAVLTAEVRAKGEALSRLLETLGAQAEALGVEGAALARRAQELADGLRMILNRLEPDYVYYAERMRRGLALRAAPVETAALLNRLLFSQAKAFVFTSATLDPPRFRERLGLGGPTEELVLASPFDFENNSRLYVPAEMPPPASPNFAPACADEMERLVNISRGRAFLLFTSFRNLDYVHRLLAPRLTFPTLKQGSAPKALLIEEFLRREGAVLFATATFWQGVDIPGPSLSLVAIDKLPFAPPDDPLIAARIDRLRALGVNPFLDYQVPAATLGLRQGLGRLIRQSTDTGILAVLDTRLFTKSYGRLILDALPPSPVVRSLDEIAAWAEERL